MSWGGLCLAETARKPSIVTPGVAAMWMCAMCVLPFLSWCWQEGRYGKAPIRPSGESLTGVLIHGRLVYSFTVRSRLSAGPGGDLAAVAEPELGQDVLDVILGRPVRNV